MAGGAETREVAKVHRQRLGLTEKPLSHVCINGYKLHVDSTRKNNPPPPPPPKKTSELPV